MSSKKTTISGEYDRMRPDERLLWRLKQYSKITYSAEPYALSVREAEFLLDLIQDLRLELRVLNDEKNS